MLKTEGFLLAAVRVGAARPLRRPDGLVGLGSLLDPRHNFYLFGLLPQYLEVLKPLGPLLCLLLPGLEPHAASPGPVRLHLPTYIIKC